MSSTPLIPFPDFHPEVNSVSRSLYESGHFTDALRKASIRLEETCKQILFEITGDEMTGKPLMQKLFGYKNKSNKKSNGENEETESLENDEDCLLSFVNLSIKDNPAKQEGYCNLYTGFALTIRNTLAHSSEDLDDIEALYGLNMVSYLFYKLDRAKEMNTVAVPTEKEPLQTTQTDDTIESSIISLLLSDSHIQLAKQIDDPLIAKLEIKKIAEETMVMSIDKIGPEVYNYYDTHEEKIILSLLSSLYDNN